MGSELTRNFVSTRRSWVILHEVTHASGVLSDRLNA